MKKILTIPYLAAALLAASFLSLVQGIDRYKVSYAGAGNPDTKQFKVYVIPFFAMAILKKLKMTADRVIEHGWNGESVMLIIANRGVDPTTINASLFDGYYPIKQLTRTADGTMVSYAIPANLINWKFAQLVDSLRLFSWIGDRGVNYVAGNMEFTTSFVPTGVLYARIPEIGIEVTPLSETDAKIDDYLALNVTYGDDEVRLVTRLGDGFVFATSEKAYVVDSFGPTETMQMMESNSFDVLVEPKRIEGIDLGGDLIVTLVRQRNGNITVGAKSGVNFAYDVETGDVAMAQLPGPIVSTYTQGDTVIVADRDADHLSRLAARTIDARFNEIAGYPIETPVVETDAGTDTPQA